MNGYILFIIVNILNIVNALQPNCASCGWFVKNNNGRMEDGMCTLFSTTTIHGKKQKVVYEYAKHCRDNKDFCGQKGELYEDITKLNLQKEKLDLLKIANIDLYNYDIDVYNYHMFFLNDF